MFVPHILWFHLNMDDGGAVGQCELHRLNSKNYPPQHLKKIWLRPRNFLSSFAHLHNTSILKMVCIQYIQSAVGASTGFQKRWENKVSKAVENNVVALVIW